MACGTRVGLAARRGAAVLAGLLLAAAGASSAGAWSAAVGGRSSPLGEQVVTSADDPQALLAAAFRLRHPAACLGFGVSRAQQPAGATNEYELGVAWSGSGLWHPRLLEFPDNPGANDAYYRSIGSVGVFDALERGEHEISWSARRNGAAAANLTVERSELALVCAKTELPWRDEGELPARKSAAVGGFTGVDAEVSSSGQSNSLIELSVRGGTLQCLAVASGTALNPGNGRVDQGYRLTLSKAGEFGEPEQRVEHDDTPGFDDLSSIPVSAVRFFPIVGGSTFTWRGKKDEDGTDVMTIAEPTLAVACTRARLGSVPFKGRAAAGGAHVNGDVVVTSEAPEELVRLDFALRGKARCAAFASAYATNPAGGTLDNVYRFRLSRAGGASSWDMLLEFDDNAGVDDIGVLPIAHAFVFELTRGDHTIEFLALKDAANDADLTVSSPSLAVFCARKAL